MKRSLTRRSVVTGLATTICAPALAQTGPLDSALLAAGHITQLHSLIIARGGKVLAAEVFRGPALDQPVNIKSVSKSLISALTGIAIQRGELAGTGQLITPLLSRSVPRRADKRVRQITVGDMLSMRSGLQQVSGAAYGAWADSRHPIYEALSKPMVADPGTDMLYSTASYHILGAVLSNVSGQDLHALAQSRLGDPMGLKIPPWHRDPQGNYFGGNDMRLSPLDLLRFGETYRRGGEWNARRIVTQSWIEQSWTVRTHSVETGHGYGFGWFIWDVGGQRVIYARGYGGQMIYIVPKLKVSVVITSNPGLPATLDGHLGALNDLFANKVVPAIVALA